MYQVKSIKSFYKYLIFYYPALYALICNIIYDIDWFLLNFFEDFITSTILLLLSIFVKNHTLKKVYLFSVFSLLSIKVFIEVSYFFLYRDVISSSIVFIMLETNTKEVKEYLLTYFDKLAYIAIFIIIPMAIGLYFIIKTNFDTNKKYKIDTIASVILIITGMLILLKFNHLGRYNLLYTSIKSYVQYIREMQKYDAYFALKTGGIFSSVTNSFGKKELYVLIIGESFSKFHSSLYGYYRKTNPLLEEISNELVVYKDVISPHGNTLASIPKILTLSDYEHPERLYKGSVLQLFNKAGFATYWISNHEPIGINETGITKITKAADRSFFINTSTHLAPYDEELLEYLDKVLMEEHNKKFIVIHLMGSHVRYKDRYPDEFNKFHDTPVSKFKNKKAYKEINEYDNSITYNDFIIRQIINKIKNKKADRAFVIYLSDHGEDVYKTSNMAYHEEDWKSKFVYQIPFIVWLPESVKADTNNYVFDVNRKYMTDDLIYSLADLANINFDQFEDHRSIFSKNFQFRKRIVLDSIDFDKTELKEKPEFNYLQQ